MTSRNIFKLSTSTSKLSVQSTATPISLEFLMAFSKASSEKQ